MKALITGSGGLIGSECVRQLSAEGWDVIGVDNDMRRQFFGEQGTTRPIVEELQATLPRYRHRGLDIRDRQAVRQLFDLLGKRGFILTPSPSIHSIMPWQNLLAMIEEWKRLR